MPPLYQAQTTSLETRRRINTAILRDRSQRGGTRARTRCRFVYATQIRVRAPSCRLSTSTKVRSGQQIILGMGHEVSSYPKNIMREIDWPALSPVCRWGHSVACPQKRMPLACDLMPFRIDFSSGFVWILGAFGMAVALDRTGQVA